MKEKKEQEVEQSEETTEDTVIEETEEQDTEAVEAATEEGEKDKKDLQIEELNDRLIRNMAEFDNFRKRSEKEKSQMFEIGAKNIIEKILPVIDNFERGLGTVTEEEKESSFVQGIEQIYKQFITALEEAGVTAIEAVGQEFNPDFHNAVMHGEDDNYGENIISDEFQKGYMYKDTVVRHSMVKVVN
ncbi:MAG: nucleotide exchange factor GrpE [Clostridiales bacterium]|nr:nucleotide exchange factor GrpE [Clostridiales bacterium]MDE7422919.1 nucleotide exchange factor GrpE [Lachnospiraceae bacterium]